MWVESPIGLAFVPDPLSLQCLDQLPDEAFPEYFAALERLKLTLERFESDAIFYRLLFQREAQTFSPRFSGSKAANLAYVNKPFVPFHVFDSVETYNYAVAAQYAWESGEKNPFNLGFLKRVHARLLPASSYAGKPRKTAIWIGKRDSVTAEDSVIILTPPPYIAEALMQAADFFGSAPATHRIAACAMLHYQLVAIHPFSDGNGRLSRALTPVILRRLKLIDSPLLFISRMLLDERWEYDTRIEAVEKYHETTAWIRLFAAILCAEIRQAARLIELVAALRSDLRQTFRKIHGNVDEFVDDVILSNTFPCSRAAALLGTDIRTAQDLLLSLKGFYSLQQVTGGQDPAFQFGDIYELLAI